jgi:hypothetical protein
VSDPTNNFVDGNVANGPTYYYVVSAADQFGESVNSTEVRASLAPPKVAFNSIAVSGASRSDLVFSGVGGSPLAPYYLRSSTDLALPVAQWQTNASNQFDASGNFSLTLTSAIDPVAPKRFYRLQTQ